MRERITYGEVLIKNNTSYRLPFLQIYRYDNTKSVKLPNASLHNERAEESIGICVQDFVLVVLPHETP